MQNSKLKTQNSKLIKGFTLIELLVVIAIIGLLTAFLVANFIGVKQRARDAQRKSDIRNIQAALEIYRSDVGSYPSSSPTLSCGPAWEYLGSTYMQSMPCDPLSTPSIQIVYSYNSTATGGYTLVACLENGNDSQKDTVLPTSNPCNQQTNFPYTLKNP